MLSPNVYTKVSFTYDFPHKSMIKCGTFYILVLLQCKFLETASCHMNYANTRCTANRVRQRFTYRLLHSTVSRTTWINHSAMSLLIVFNEKKKQLDVNCSSRDIVKAGSVDCSASSIICFI